MTEEQPWQSDDVMTRLRWWAFKFCGKGDQENLASDAMSDAITRIEQLEIDLEVEECRKSAAMPFHSGLLERTEKLTAALQEIAELSFWDGDSAMNIARKALEGKDDE